MDTPVACKNIPNCITALRIAAAACLLFLGPLSPEFFAVYTLAGLSDVLDGWLARRLNASSPFGARLDSVADLSFYAVMLLRIFPVMRVVLPREIWLCVGTIILVRLCSYAVAALRFRRFASLHTVFNKLTGAAVFFIPYVIRTPAAAPFCWGACALGGLSSLHELLVHIRAREYPDDRRNNHEPA